MKYIIDAFGFDITTTDSQVGSYQSHIPIGSNLKPTTNSYLVVYDKGLDSEDRFYISQDDIDKLSQLIGVVNINWGFGVATVQVLPKVLVSFIKEYDVVVVPNTKNTRLNVFHKPLVDFTSVTNWYTSKIFIRDNIVDYLLNSYNIPLVDGKIKDDFGYVLSGAKYHVLYINKHHRSQLSIYDGVELYAMSTRTLSGEKDNYVVFDRDFNIQFRLSDIGMYVFSFIRNVHGYADGDVCVNPVIPFDYDFMECLERFGVDEYEHLGQTKVVDARKLFSNASTCSACSLINVDARIYTVSYFFINTCWSFGVDLADLKNYRYVKFVGLCNSVLFELTSEYKRYYKKLIKMIMASDGDLFRYYAEKLKKLK